jgi:putative ABC transport system ATP-binding protein
VTPALQLQGLRYRWPGAPTDTIAIDALQLAPGQR